MFSGLPPKADLPPDLRATPAASSSRTPPSRPRVIGSYASVAPPREPASNSSARRSSTKDGSAGGDRKGAARRVARGINRSTDDPLQLRNQSESGIVVLLESAWAE